MGQGRRASSSRMGGVMASSVHEDLPYVHPPDALHAGPRRPLAGRPPSPSSPNGTTVWLGSAHGAGRANFCVTSAPIFIPISLPTTVEVR
jgi:hypothetical protein